MIRSLSVKGHEYRDLIAGYLLANFAEYGVGVYTEVELGKTIIGKNRRIDVFAVRESDQRALAIECKFQSTSGTTDEKIPYALQDLDALWMPGCLAYAGEGWSAGVLHTLEGSRLAVHCLPDGTFARTKATLELDHLVGAVFGLWSMLLPDAKRFQLPRQPVAGRHLGTKRATQRELPLETTDAKATKQRS